MHHARQGCKPQSVESCEPRSQTRAGLAVQGDSLAPVSYQKRERGRKKKTLQGDSIYWKEPRQKAAKNQQK